MRARHPGTIWLSPSAQSRCHETISKITDQISEEVLAWQTRPGEALYPVIYLDAIMVKIRGGAHVSNRAAHIAVGVDMEGVKHVLGIWAPGP